METKIRWYNAKEVLPAKNCRVLVIHCVSCEGIPYIMDVEYANGEFNPGYHMHVLYWAYLPDIKSVDPEYTEEDDF